MKKFLLMAVVSLLFASFGCNSISPNSVKKEADIIAGMQKAVDVSGKLDDIKSALLVYESGLGDKNKSEVTLKICENGKFRLEVRHENKLMIKAYNGKTAWEYTTGKGLRTLTGKELYELKFQSVYMAPRVNFDKLFASVKLVGNEKVAGADCWELVCDPKPEFESQPVIFFIAKKDYLLKKTVEQLDTNDKVVEIATYFGNYEDIDGILMSRLMVSQIDNNQLVEVKLLSAEWNVKFADSEFDEPQAISKAK